MSRVRLVIGGEVADLDTSREFPFKIDYQIEDIRDFITRKGGGGSRTFKLPGTEKNNFIFNNIAVARVDTDTVKLAQDASVEIDGVPVASGTIRLARVTTRNDTWSRTSCEYEAAFLTDNSDWISKMDGVKLSELDFPDHEFNLINWSKQDVTAASSDYGYTLIKWKKWKNAGYLTREEYTPFLFLKPIIIKAFESIGYTVDSTWLSTDFAERLIMPVPLRNYGSGFFRDYTDATATLVTPIIVGAAAATIVFDDDSTPPNFDTGGNYNAATGIFTAPYDGRYRFQCVFTLSNITVTSGSAGFATAMIKNGTSPPTIPPTPFIFPGVVNGDELFIDIETDLVAGDTMEFKVSPSGVVTGYDITAGNMDIRAQRVDWVFGTDVVWEHLVPNIDVLDLIRGFSELFNIYIYGDSAAQKVTFEPRQIFINDTRDMTTKVDGAKKGSKSLRILQLLQQFKYKNDGSDTTVDTLNEAERLPLYAGEYRLSDSTATGENSIENSFFAPTLHIRDTTIAGFAGADTPPQIPLIYPEDYVVDPNETETDYKFEPRILYHKGRTPVTDLTGTTPSAEGSINLLASDPNSRQQYPLSFMVNYYNSGTDPSLAFGTQEVAFGNTVDGLIRNFWLEYLATINNGVQVEEWLRFTIIDLLQQDFRSRFAIQGDKFLVQKISGFNPTIQDSTKTILLEEKCPEQDDVDRLSGSTLTGFIND